MQKKEQLRKIWNIGIILLWVCVVILHLFLYHFYSFSIFKLRIKTLTGLLLTGIFIVFIWKMNHDISQINQLQKTLEESEAEYRTLIENSPDVVIRFNRELRHLYINRAVETVTGISKEYFIGKTHREIGFDPDLCTIWEEIIQKVFNTQMPFQTELELNRSKGLKYFDWQLVPEFSRDGEVVSVLSIIRDITKRIQTEKALRKDEERLEMKLEGTMMGFWNWDIGTDTMIINEHWSEMSGFPFSSEEMYFNTWKDFLHPDDHETVKQKLQNCLSERWNMCEVEARFRAVSGEWRWFLFRGKVVAWNEEGKPLRVAGTAMDIDDKKKSYLSLLESKKKLTLLNKQEIVTIEEERRRLSREIHDEIGQALTALKINLELIITDLPGEFRDIKRRLDEAIQISGETLDQLRILAHNLRPPALDALGLNPTLDDFCREFSRRTNIQVVYEGVELPELPDEIGITFYRILQESLTNIVKHAHANKALVKLSFECRIIQLTIRDNGVGFRLDNKVKRDGIGLSGMQERLEILGGYLRIDSQSGEGTCLVAGIKLEEKHDQNTDCG